MSLRCEARGLLVRYSWTLNDHDHLIKNQTTEKSSSDVVHINLAGKYFCSITDEYNVTVWNYTTIYESKYILS